MNKMWFPGRIVILMILAVALLTPVPNASSNDEEGLEQNAPSSTIDSLAVGIPFEMINNQIYAGAVNVILGYDPVGLDTPDNKLWSQEGDVGGQAEQDDNLGLSLASGDFNGDGYSDLVMGVPNEDVDPGTGTEQANAGAVNVLYGTASGLSSDNNQLLHQNFNGIEGYVEEYDYFGDSLTAGDFNGDGFDDLAIGVPGEDLPVSGTEIIDAGVVNVLYGTASGLRAVGYVTLWHQDSVQDNIEIFGQAEANDNFGDSLTAGDFDGDGYDDLVIGVPHEGVDPEGPEPNQEEAGAVNVIYGTSAGLNTAGNQIWYQAVNGIKDTPEEGDLFGESLAAGDFDGDSYDDLAIGVPHEDVDPEGSVPIQFDAGMVNVIYGTHSGLNAAGNQIWHQAVDGIKGTLEGYDMFGDSLSAGNFNGDKYMDLAIGEPWEGVDPGAGPEIYGAGAVNVIYGSNTGLDAYGDQLWHQAQSGVQDYVEIYDHFGASLAAGDFDGDGIDDLAVGAPGEGVDPGTGEEVASAGAVNVLYGSTSGLSAIDDQFWHQAKEGIVNAPSVGDEYGSALAAMAGGRTAWGTPPQTLKLLFVPLNWTKSQAAFDREARTQVDAFLDEIPLDSCRDQVVIEILDVETQNFNTFTCLGTDSCGAWAVQAFVDNIASINSADYDVIVGLAETSPCLPVKGCTNYMGTVWIIAESDVVLAHELGHNYGLRDEYCSKQAGSTNTRCNDGDSQGDGAVTGDPNWLDASLPCDCPPDGLNDSNGSRCCNFNGYDCAEEDLNACCLGNKNKGGGRSIMSFATAPGPRGYDIHDLAELNSREALYCGHEIVYDHVLDIRLKIKKDDTVIEDKITITQGRPTSDSVLEGMSGSYTMAIMGGNADAIVWSQAFDVYFGYSGPVVEGDDYSGVLFDETSVWFRVLQSNEMQTLKLYHDDKLIFSKELPTLNSNYLPLVFRSP